jgi:hypothetical protein
LDRLSEGRLKPGDRLPPQRELASQHQRENTVVFICTGSIIIIVVAGSLWVMHNANVNMMPMNMSVERAMSHD